MGYAFENTPWHELPRSEQEAIMAMKARIRENMLTPDELMACTWDLTAEEMRLWAQGRTA